MSGPRGTNERGFTLMELVVVVAVLIALSALLIPAVSGVLEDAKVAQVVTEVNSLKTACAKHYMDTGSFAHEYCGTQYMVQPQHRQLTAPQTYRGWKGPYIESPLDTGNPWGGRVHLYATLLVNGLTGWDLDYDGNPELTTADTANVLWLSDVPADQAEAIDEALDPPVASGGDWRTSGRVQWNENGYLWVMIHKR